MLAVPAVVGVVSLGVGSIFGFVSMCTMGKEGAGMHVQMQSQSQNGMQGAVVHVPIQPQNEFQVGERTRLFLLVNIITLKYRSCRNHHPRHCAAVRAVDGAHQVVTFKAVTVLRRCCCCVSKGHGVTNLLNSCGICPISVVLDKVGLDCPNTLNQYRTFRVGL